MGLAGSACGSVGFLRLGREFSPRLGALPSCAASAGLGRASSRAGREAGAGLATGACVAAGADAVLFKPIAMQSLFDSIAEIVVDRSDPDATIG